MCGFKLICCKCGSDNVLEKSSCNKLDGPADRNIYAKGVQRKCLDCSNESFKIIRSFQKD